MYSLSTNHWKDWWWEVCFSRKSWVHFLSTCYDSSRHALSWFEQHQHCQCMLSNIKHEICLMRLADQHVVNSSISDVKTPLNVHNVMVIDFTNSKPPAETMRLMNCICCKKWYSYHNEVGWTTFVWTYSGVATKRSLMSLIWQLTQEIVMLGIRRWLNDRRYAKCYHPIIYQKVLILTNQQMMQKTETW